MPSRDFVDVRITVDGKPLKEYYVPDEHPDTEHRQTRYIEVKAGQKFEVQIKWQAGFSLRFAKLLYCDVSMDSFTWYSSVTQDCQTWQHRRGILEHEYFSSLSSVCLRDESTGEWQRCPYTFGALGTNDEKESQISVDEISKLGAIRIQYFRADRLKKPIPAFFNEPRPKTIDEIPERLLKGKNIKNNIKIPAGTPAETPPPLLYDYFPIGGQYGKVNRVVFLYRSRKILQSLGCIPRSPSPPPDPTLMLERTEEMLKISKQRERSANLELLRMREEMARQSPAMNGNVVIHLEDDATTPIPRQFASVKVKNEEYENTRTALGIKTEPVEGARALVTTNPIMRIIAGTENATLQGTKRTREEDEDELAEVAPPPLKPKVEIDLTEDD